MSLQQPLPLSTFCHLPVFTYTQTQVACQSNSLAQFHRPGKCLFKGSAATDACGIVDLQSPTPVAPVMAIASVRVRAFGDDGIDDVLFGDAAAVTDGLVLPHPSGQWARGSESAAIFRLPAIIGDRTGRGEAEPILQSKGFCSLTMANTVSRGTGCPTTPQTGQFFRYHPPLYYILCRQGIKKKRPSLNRPLLCRRRVWCVGQIRRPYKEPDPS